MKSDINLVDVMTRFSTDAKCREFLKRLRWPNGPECLRCHGKAVELETEKELFYCAECDYQFTVTTGSIFNDSHLALTKWFIATLLLVESRKGFSANELKRVIGVAYRTAWYLFHRIRFAMHQAEKPMLDGKVEMDETYVGGKMKGGKRGRGSENKEIVIGIRQRNGDLRFFHAQDVKSGTLAQYIKDNISQDVEVMMTDDLNVYPSAMRQADVDATRHKSVNHSAGVYVMGDIHTNTVENAFSLLKRGIMGTWHKLSAKYLPAYLEEMEFRFNRRNNADLFVDTLRHMITSPALTFEALTQDSAA